MRSLKPFVIFGFSSSLLVASACNSSKALQDQIVQAGYIPFKTPLSDSGTGTIVGGTPSRLSWIAGPQTCFPNVIAGQPTLLRHRDDSSLPRQSRSTSVGFQANLEVLQLMSGNGMLKAGANFSHVERMELAFDGVHVEYLDSVLLTKLYRSADMDLVCKEYLELFGFITQALQADRVTFKFYDQTGGAINLSVDKVKDIVDIDTSVQFQVVSSLELVITSPRYLGYQLGRLQKQDNGLIFYRASSVKDGHFVFDPAGVFQWDDEGLPFNTIP